MDYYNTEEGKNIEAKDSSQDKIENDCAGGKIRFIMIPIVEASDRRKLGVSNAIYWALRNKLNTINSKKKEKTDVVEMSYSEIMYVIGGGEEKNFARYIKKLVDDGLIEVLRKGKSKFSKTLYRLLDVSDIDSHSPQNEGSDSPQNEGSDSPQNEGSDSPQNEGSEVKENPCNSLKDCTLQTSTETPNNIINNTTNNNTTKQQYTVYLDSSGITDQDTPEVLFDVSSPPQTPKGADVSTKSQRTKKEIRLRAQKQNRQPNVSDSVKSEMSGASEESKPSTPLKSPPPQTQVKKTRTDEQRVEDMYNWLLDNPDTEWNDDTTEVVEGELRYYLKKLKNLPIMSRPVGEEIKGKIDDSLRKCMQKGRMGTKISREAIIKNADYVSWYNKDTEVKSLIDAVLNLRQAAIIYNYYKREKTNGKREKN